jgi:heme-degrading monooxygenase HmoA
MFGRVVTYKFPPEKFDELFGEMFKSYRLPEELTASHGFKGQYVLADRKNGKTMSLSLWETEADIGASEEANRARQARLQERGVQALSQEQFEVVKGT